MILSIGFHDCLVINSGIWQKIQRERYIRMLVADGQGPSISSRKGVMYVVYTLIHPMVFQFLRHFFM